MFFPHRSRVLHSLANSLELRYALLGTKRAGNRFVWGTGMAHNPWWLKVRCTTKLTIGVVCSRAMPGGPLHCRWPTSSPSLGTVPWMSQVLSAVLPQALACAATFGSGRPELAWRFSQAIPNLSN